MKTIKFCPIYKPTLWGGETWLISAVQGSESVADGGDYAGRSLPELVKTYGAELVGQSIYAKFGNDFPLLVKLIDARQDLSIQVHPNDEMARREHGKFGKNEMWYVVNADDGACLIDGFSHPMKEEQYEAAVEDGSIEDFLNKVPVSEGDVFYIPAGRVHGIGAGLYIAEIQQSSDVTYRLFDYNRKDKNGNKRELHTQLAKKALTFGEVTAQPRTPYSEKINEVNTVVKSPYFTTSVLKVTKTISINYSETDSFVVLMCLQGAVTLTDNDGQKVSLNKDEAALVPASTSSLTISPIGTAKLLESKIEITK